MFQLRCRQLYGWRDCSGSDGFSFEVLEHVLEPPLDEIEKQYKEGNADELLQKQEKRLGTIKNDINYLKDVIRETLIEALLYEKAEGNPTGKEAQFLSLFNQNLDGDTNMDILRTELWKEIKVTHPWLEKYLEKHTIDYINLKKNKKEIEGNEEINRNLEIEIKSLHYPILHVKRLFIYPPPEEFRFSVFFDEFVKPEKHSDPKIINLGYILSMTQATASFNHAVCVVRQYPFSTYGAQNLVVLDSGNKMVLNFNNHVGMIQYLSSAGYLSISSFLSIYGYSKKPSELEERRSKLITLLYNFKEELSSAAASNGEDGEIGEGGGGGGRSIMAAASGKQGGGGGGGGSLMAPTSGEQGGCGMQGGKTFYSFPLNSF